MTLQFQGSVPRAAYGRPEQHRTHLDMQVYLLEVLVLVSLLAIGLRLVGQRAHGRLNDAASNSDR